MLGFDTAEKLRKVCQDWNDNSNKGIMSIVTAYSIVQSKRKFSTSRKPSAKKRDKNSSSKMSESLDESEISKFTLQKEEQPDAI